MTKLILIYGNTGSGKDTQAKLLLESINSRSNSAIWFNSSDLLKQALPDFAARVANGNLTSDAEVSEIVLDAIRDIGLKQDYVILTGYPRTTNQTTALLKFCEGVDLILAKALILEVPESELLSRLSLRNDGRSDASPDVARKRFKIYSENTKSILEVLHQKKIATELIDGVGLIEAIHSRILEATHELF